MAEQPEPSLAGGASGYLSPPESNLDPALFGPGDMLRHDVASKVMAPLLSFMQQRGFHWPVKWLKAWLAGSAITYQWHANRGNGDLDVLLGIDRVKFDEANPAYRGFGDENLAAELNQHLKAGLWPRTAHLKINSREFEVTYYYNPGTGTDITHINPYAAYDILADRWVVPPPHLPHNPVDMFPRSWFERAKEDTAAVQDLVARYREAESGLVHGPGSPGYINAEATIRLLTAQAQARLTDIHHGRALAFQGGGRGYTDWHNFRWQQAKASGAVKALSELVGVRERAEEDRDTELYGGPVSASDELVRRAMLYRRNG